MGAKVPGSESYLERLLQGATVPGSESSTKQKFQVTKVTGSKSSMERIGQGTTGTFTPGSELAHKRKGYDSVHHLFFFLSQTSLLLSQHLLINSHCLTSCLLFITENVFIFTHTAVS